MVRKYSEEMINYLRKITPGRYTPEILTMFNEKFGLDLSKSQIASLRKNYGIRSNVPTRNPTGNYGRKFTDEQEQFIRDNYLGRTNQELTDLFNDHWKTTFSLKQIKSWKHRHKLSSGLTGFFEKGHEPVNKGTKGMFNVGGNSGSFKKGQLPINADPVGTEVLRDDGYLWVKVEDPNVWKAKHRIAWEASNGPIPEDMLVILLDRNPNNVELDNLMLITKAQNIRLNQNGWRFDDPELQKLGLKLADLKISTAAAKRRLKKNKKRST